MIEAFHQTVDFLHRFHRGLCDSPQVDPRLIPTDLPGPLATLYREFGELVEFDRKDLAPFSHQDSILSLSRLKRINGMVEFASENQGNWTCRCPLGEGDPPVLCNIGEISHQEEVFEAVCGKLSHFLTTLTLQESVMSCPVLFSTLDESATNLLECVPPALWINGVYVYKEPTHNFYYDERCDLLVMEHKFIGVWLGSHADRFRELLRSEVASDPDNWVRN